SAGATRRRCVRRPRGSRSAGRGGPGGSPPIDPPARLRSPPRRICRSWPSLRRVPPPTGKRKGRKAGRRFGAIAHFHAAANVGASTHAPAEGPARSDELVLVGEG